MAVETVLCEVTIELQVHVFRMQTCLVSCLMGKIPYFSVDFCKILAYKYRICPIV